MEEVRQGPFRNNLLRRLPEKSLARLEPRLERIALPRSFQLSSPHQPMDHAYFFENGIASVVIRSPEGQHTEIGVIGRDGMCPTAAILDTDADPFSVFMQVQGEAYRVAIPDLTALLAEDRDMQGLFARYAQALAVQHAYTALSNAVHHIDERLARWILMCHDRTDGAEISLTHEFLSIMLAVRRPSVTTRAACAGRQEADSTPNAVLSSCVIAQGSRRSRVMPMANARRNMSGLSGRSTAEAPSLVQRVVERQLGDQLSAFIDDFEPARLIPPSLAQVVGEELAGGEAGFGKGGRQVVEIPALQILDPFGTAANVKEVVGHLRLGFAIAYRRYERKPLVFHRCRQTTSVR
jgi:CRP-like cAMP-binding protein